MMDIRSNSSNNTVFADSENNIAYFHGNFVPRRDPRFDYSKPVDGSDPATDWQGIHTVDEVVTVLNPPNGWIQNTNATPFTAAGEFSPKREDYPLYMAPDPENFRGLNAVRVLTGIDDLTLDGLIGLAHDPYLPGFEQLIEGLIEAYDADEPDPALAAPIETLRAWDRRSAIDSVALTLAHFHGITSVAEGTAPAGLSRMETVNHYGTNAPPAERLAIFAATVRMLEADFGGWEIPWGEVNRFQRHRGGHGQQRLGGVGRLRLPSRQWHEEAIWTERQQLRGRGRVRRQAARKVDPRRRAKQRSGIAAFHRPGAALCESRVERRRVLSRGCRTTRDGTLRARRALSARSTPVLSRYSYLCKIRIDLV
jgi:acyl-homoserine lactone acylase PvdQ